MSIRREKPRRYPSAKGVNSVMRPIDRRLGLLFALLLVASAVATAVVWFCTDVTGYEALPILAIPLFAIGLISYILDKRYYAMIAVLAIALAAFFVYPDSVLFVLYVLVCAEGVATMVGVIQRLLFFRVLRAIEFVNIKDRMTITDRILVFFFNIPVDLDTRNLTMDRGVIRDGVPVRDMLQSMVIALLLCMFLWIYMFLNPSLEIGTSGVPIYTFTIILYIAMLVMPWSIFSSLNVRIVTPFRDFKIYSGLFETIKRMFLPVFAAIVFLWIAVSSSKDVGLIAMSLVMIVVMIVFTSVMYYTKGEADVFNDISAEWVSFHPVDIFSGYGEPGSVSSMDDGVPGTPRRDPDSCFSIRQVR